MKYRGREHLWIIYGPEYTKSENLERLRRQWPGREQLSWFAGPPSRTCSGFLTPRFVAVCQRIRIAPWIQPIDAQGARQFRPVVLLFVGS